MRKAEEYIPQIKKSPRYEELSEMWSEVFSKRKKIVGSKKAKYSANAVVKAELLKEFSVDSKTNILENRIKNNWLKEEDEEGSDCSDKLGIDYNIYPIDDMNVVVSTDKDMFKKCKDVRRKGMIKNLEDEYEIEILDKLSDEYNIKLHPDLYYMMWSVDNG